MKNKFLKTAFSEKLTEGEILSLGMNRIKDGKYYEFSARLDGELSEAATVFICHGHMVSYGRWLEISEKEIKICNFTSWANPQLSERVYEHGIKIKNFIKVSIVFDTENDLKKIEILTDGGEYSMDGGHFNCCDGEICAFVKGTQLYDASLGFFANGYSHDIWIVGASYLSLGDPARWPYYWYADGVAGPLLVGRGGMGAQHGISDLKDALNYGTPKILVWDSVSGNNPDSDDALNSLFYENTLEMLKICKEKGTKVYIQTMPNCIERTNVYKNEAILNRSGEFGNYDYEIIDLARAVDARDTKYSSWFENMLYTDKVHPTRLGGRASYLGIVCDAPELIIGKECNVYSSCDGKLADIKSGERLILSDYGDIKRHSAVTFRADFEGEMQGKLVIGSENGSRLVIDKEILRVYTSYDGKEKLVAEAINPALLKKIVNVKIDVAYTEAKISLMSAGERNLDVKSAELLSLSAPWNISGDIFAEADGINLIDARIKFASADK